MTIELIQSKEGILLPVRVQPGAKRTAVIGIQNGSLRVAVNAPPDKGKANEAVQELLCEVLGLRKRQIELVAGATSRQKKFAISEIPREDLLERILSCMKQSD